MQRSLFSNNPRKDEVWTRIEGFPDYHISSHGRVYSCRKKNGILSTTLQSTGYAYVQLVAHAGAARVNKLVHRLVIKSFGPAAPTDQHTHVNHIDGCKTNNRIDNLEWVTEWENRLHGAILTAFEKGDIDIVESRVKNWLLALG